MVVMSNPVPGREEEFERWYQEVHLPELVALDGFVSAQRFNREVTLGAAQSWPHMAIYEIESEDIEATIGALVTVAEAGKLTMSGAIDTAATSAAVFKACGPAITRTG
jgi:hypothetical protein